VIEEVFDVSGPAAPEVVDTEDLVAVVEEGVTEVAADEARAAGDERSFS
jgi:hypothetical protein